MMLRIDVAAMILLLAMLATVHVSIVYGLARRDSWRHALLAGAVAPLAPYFAVRGAMRVRAGLWIACAVLYATAAVVALTTSAV